VTLYLVLVFAAAVSMTVIPLMRRLAPRLGLLDLPGEVRKVHKAPVPRVGGWGIVLGLILPVLFLVEHAPLLEGYLVGVALLFAVGVVDDIFERGHYPKFITQIAAAGVVVLHGHLWIWHMPLLGLDPWSPALGIPFTVFAIVGMINAINHSDGLDGLAGGEALLSLIVVLFLGTVYGGDPMLVTLAAAAIGGVLGFLRYNTHPATVFMGDAGSQVLGFTLAVLVIDLTRQVSPTLSPAVVLLILGLPVIDILAVLVQRIYHGMHWFQASRNHIHHRLLDLGLDHYDVVVIIYGLQGVMVSFGVLLRFENDALVLLAYAAICATLFATVTWLERSGWRAYAGGRRSALRRVVEHIRENPWVNTVPSRALLLLVTAYFIVTALRCQEVPQDFGWMSLGLLAVLAPDPTLLRSHGTRYVMNVIYIVAVFLVFLSRGSMEAEGLRGTFEIAVFVLMAVLVALTVKFQKTIRFGTTPLDYLIVLGLITMVLISGYYRQLLPLSLLVVKGAVLLYALEAVGQRLRQRLNPLTASTAVALGILVFRGLL